MLTDDERRALEIMSQRHLITKEEIALLANGQGASGFQLNFQHLIDLGYIEKVESLGTCFVITQAGIRAVRE